MAISRKLIPLLFVLPLAVQGQNDAKASVQTLINQFFDAMRAGDSAKISGLFYPGAEMGSTYVKDRKPQFRESSPKAFLQAVGTPHTEVWDERVSDLNIQVDDNLASAWMKFAFYRGATFSHCGVNHFTLINTETGWKILAIVDTRRMGEACGAN